MAKNPYLKNQIIGARSADDRQANNNSIAE
jgi:hypothetical protein